MECVAVLVNCTWFFGCLGNLRADLADDVEARERSFDRCASFNSASISVSRVILISLLE